MIEYHCAHAVQSGAHWHVVPQGYPKYKTVHRRFQQWCREETLRKVLTDLANTLREEGEIDECVSLPPEQVEQVKQLSALTRVPMAAYFREALEDLLRKYSAVLRKRK